MIASRAVRTLNGRLCPWPRVERRHVATFAPRCAIECGRPLLFVSIVSQYDARGMTTDDALHFLQNTKFDDDCIKAIEASGRAVSQLTETICGHLAAHVEQNSTRLQDVKFAGDASAHILQARRRHSYYGLY